jgi:hypothetical protein
MHRGHAQIYGTHVCADVRSMPDFGIKAFGEWLWTPTNRVARSWWES